MSKPRELRLVIETRETSAVSRPDIGNMPMVEVKAKKAKF